MLGRFCYFLNFQIESVHFYLNLSSSAKILQQKDQHQKKIINELLVSVSQWTAMPIPADFNEITKSQIKFHTDGKPILEFALPRINGYYINLPQDKIISDNKGIGSFQPWKSLLPKEYVKAMDNFKYFDGEPGKNLKRALYCKESIEIIVKCFNPMNFLLTAENIVAVLEHESGESFETKAIDKIELNSNEEKSILLECVQENPGKLNLKYLKWSFGNVFYGIYNFPNQEFIILPAVSGLSVEFINFPEKLLEGQIKNLQIIFKNQDLNELKDIRINFSHGFLFGKNSFTIEELLPSAEQKIDM